MEESKLYYRKGQCSYLYVTICGRELACYAKKETLKAMVRDGKAEAVLNGDQYTYTIADNCIDDIMIDMSSLHMVCYGFPDPYTYVLNKLKADLAYKGIQTNKKINSYITELFNSTKDLAFDVDRKPTLTSCLSMRTFWIICNAILNERALFDGDVLGEAEVPAIEWAECWAAWALSKKAFYTKGPQDESKPPFVENSTWLNAFLNNEAVAQEIDADVVVKQLAEATANSPERISFDYNDILPQYNFCSDPDRRVAPVAEGPVPPDPTRTRFNIRGMAKFAFDLPFRMRKPHLQSYVEMQNRQLGSRPGIYVTKLGLVDSNTVRAYATIPQLCDSNPITPGNGERLANDMSIQNLMKLQQSIDDIYDEVLDLYRREVTSLHGVI